MQGPHHASSVTCIIPFSSRGKIDPGFASCYITSLLHAHVLGPVDSSKEFPLFVRDLLFDMLMTNFRKSMWEARDKAAKITSSQDLTASMDYGPERSQAAKCNQVTHLEKNVYTSGSVSYTTYSQKSRHELERAPTFRELFDRTSKRKGTNDYVSESARTIAETYDRTMVDRYVEGTPQPDLDLEAWVNAVGGPRKGRVYGFGDSLDTTPVLSLYACSVAPPTYASLSAALWHHG
ncbi:hypothetical protein Taro_027434 [Colocasia esculenta]|uniref:Uncharacterized protein n=1 Tax=Colocasia esculenta TaxID=4460 RepID=A0A843VI33_COLES|nr:hypothetical protein [Colocasia esculenta]